MDNDDGSLVGASTDTSFSDLVRELRARAAEEDQDGAGLSTSSLLLRHSIGQDTVEITSAGDTRSASQTLTQGMRTMIGGDRHIQHINLAEDSDENGISVYSPEIEVYVAPSAGSLAEKSSGSNKVKITSVVNHVWDLKYYHGNLVAVHRDAVYMAYVIQGGAKGKNSGNVRVISRKSAHRVLLKDFAGSVVDIAFALSSDIYLAAADESGSVHVYYFTMEGDSIVSNPILHIKADSDSMEPDRTLTRIIWCPYMPEDDNEDGPDPAKMLVLLHGAQAEVWNVDIVFNKFGSHVVTSKTVNSGVMCIEPHEPGMSVVNAAFAPDGSAVAVAYTSGIVKFFLVDLYGEETDTACMHDWSPHDGHPVTSLYFLDDHKHPGVDLQLWKFALTGALHNTEIKLWSCETWACMQTITFRPPAMQPDLKLRLKSGIDLTSKYLVLSDINSRVLYVLQIYQKYDSNTVHISSLSQFSLTQPCLSFAIFDAGVKRFRHSANDSHLDEITTGELNENQEDVDEQEVRNGADSTDKVTTGVQIRMYGVHTKALQELLIRYRPESSVPFPHTSSVSSTSQEEVMRNMLSDASLDQSGTSQDLAVVSPSTPTRAAVAKTFEASSPGTPSVSQADQTLLSTSSTSSFTHVTPLREDYSGIHSPHGSVDHSTELSPGGSTFTQTPSQSRPSPGANVSLSEVPLPPVTSSEEAELATPKSTSGGNHSMNASSRGSQEVLDDMFAVNQKIIKTVAGLGNSIETVTSTGSFPVGNLRASYNDHEDRYDEDDKEVAEALGLEKEENLEEIEESVSSPPQEERKDLLWPEPPDVFTESKGIENEDTQQSVREEEEEKDFYDDENDEAEVEEIIQCLEADDEEDDVEDDVGAQRDYSKRPQRSDMSQTPVGVLNSIDLSIARIVKQLHAQQELMQQMQSELNRQREIQLQLHHHQVEQDQLQHMAVQQPSLEADISKLEDILVSRMEHSLAQHMQRETQRLQESLKASDAQRKQRDDALHENMIDEVGRTVKDTVSNVLRTEIKQTVTPALHKFVEPMKEKIHQEVAHRLTACDTLIKDNIAKAVKSRSTMDVLAAAVGDAIYQQMQQAYTDTFKSAMLPSFKSIMEKTVTDVHGIFQQGTKEYQLYMRQNMDQMLRERVATESVVSRMEAAGQKFLHNVDQMKTLVINNVKEELRGQVARAVTGIKDDILSDVRKIMKEELTSAMKEHGASISDKLTTYLRSGAATPVPLSSEEEHSKERIARELRMGRINDAFQCALSAGNLDLVVYTCEAADPYNIFAKSPCPLTQPVLLSLISQLTANLDKSFDLKMKYLEEAVMNLDAAQPMTADHIPNVLGGLIQKLRVAETHVVDARKSKSIKMLIMAASSLLS
ncbi:unnamed protein product [Candidula unifasciata]|uniref:Enhancer of mRNA-decapping protein 4 WD40 repeat region domain-containing protein n=1 Tax=Candidula unifasciata TaxID=100452 RepID=A0A8S3ZSU8_9EUPU|nr:unnamed protein product [Candidula unifasciata]